jgi:hypothetical protein
VSYINPDSEDAAIEKPTIALFESLDWKTLNCYHLNYAQVERSERRTRSVDVSLVY